MSCTFPSSATSKFHVITSNVGISPSVLSLACQDVSLYFYLVLTSCDVLYTNEVFKSSLKKVLVSYKKGVCFLRAFSFNEGVGIFKTNILKLFCKNCENTTKPHMRFSNVLCRHA